MSSDQNKYTTKRSPAKKIQNETHDIQFDRSLTEQNEREVLLGKEVEVQLVGEALGHDSDPQHHFHVKEKCRQNSGISSSFPSLLLEDDHKLPITRGM